MQRGIFKKFLYIILLGVAVFVAFNWQYFWVQINYYINPPAPALTETSDDQEDAPNAGTLRIQSLGIEAPIVYMEQENPGENEFQEALQDGVVHFPGTALPGRPGNAYIFGHSSDYPTAPGDYKTVFALLPKIQKGAIIEVADKNNNLYRYEVDSTRVISPKDLSVLNQDESKYQLTLQTSYPIGTALRRFIVIAYLVD